MISSSLLTAAADASAADLSEWSTLKVPGLKDALSERGLPTKGTKQQLLLRLQAALKQEDTPSSKPEVKPGIAGIKDVATAEASCTTESHWSVLEPWNLVSMVWDPPSYNRFCSDLKSVFKPRFD